MGHIFIFAQVVDGDFIFWAFRYEEVLNDFGMGARDLILFCQVIDLGFITTIVLHDILTPGIFKSFNEFFTVLFVVAEEAPNFDFFFFISFNC